MKTAISILLALVQLHANSQEAGYKQVDSSPFVSCFIQNQNFIYRKIDNYVTIIIDESFNDALIECPTCDTIFKSDIKNTYVVRAERARYTEIIVSSKQPDTLLSFKFEFQNSYLPPPTLYLGSAPNGTQCTRSETNLSAAYPREMNLNHNFEIKRWTIYIGDQKFNGVGSSISDEASKLLNSNKDIEIVSIIAVVLGPDGSHMQIGGTYSL